MAPTSDKRREVAERLRELDVYITSRDTLERAVDKLLKATYGERPFSPIRYSVRNLCGLGYVLADLIDPTCHVSDEEVTHQPTLDAMAVHVYTCDRCNSPFYMGDVCMHPKPLYCPYCGARVVDDD